jgi:hypothetical protein
MARPRQPKRAETYVHDEEALLRPEVGTQAQFRKRKPPTTYRYDSSLSPALDWDGKNGARELGEWLLAQIEAASTIEPPFVFPEPRTFGDVGVAGLHDAVARLKALSRPFLDCEISGRRRSRGGRGSGFYGLLQIAAHLGCSVTTVHRRVHARGADARRSPPTFAE